jgi:hypothetical protein
MLLLLYQALLFNLFCKFIGKTCNLIDFLMESFLSVWAREKGHESSWVQGLMTSDGIESLELIEAT